MARRCCFNHRVSYEQQTVLDDFNVCLLLQFFLLVRTLVLLFLLIQQICNRFLDFEGFDLHDEAWQWHEACSEEQHDLCRFHGVRKSQTHDGWNWCNGRNKSQFKRSKGYQGSHALFLLNKQGDTSNYNLILIDSALLLCLQGWRRV